MKLEDIDILVGHRKDYLERKAQVAQITKNAPSNIQFGSVYVRDADILAKVRVLVCEEITRKFNEATTRMMQLGVTEFPE